jgi:O-antigen biosynthesis protein
MPFVSYARNCEDVVLWRVFRDVERGFYIDVGATDPEAASVTRAFYERGWSGIDIQPLKEPFQRLVEPRVRDTNLEDKVGRELRLCTSPPSSITSPSLGTPEAGSAHRDADNPVNETALQKVTLMQAIKRAAPSTIHFLRIDAEGTPSDLLEEFDFDRFRPWIVLIVTGASNASVSAREKWEHLITKCRYSFAYFDGLTCFYVADEVSGLKERLALPPNIFDDYVRSQEQLNGDRILKLENQLASLRNYAAVMEASLKDAATHSARLEKLLIATRSESAERNTALQAEQAQVTHLLERVELLAASSQRSPIAHEAQRFLDRLRVTGNRLTGGGLRALAHRMATMSVRSTLQKPRLAAIAHAILKPIPGATSLLSKLDATPQSGETSEDLILPVSEEQLRYNRWVAVYDTINASDRSLIRAHISSFTSQPLISVIISTSETPYAALRDSFNSVIKQLYTHWEMCVAVNDVTDPQVEAFLRLSKTSDQRVKLVRSDSRLGGTSATNAALDLATGEFVVFLGAGDILPEHALYEVAFSLGSDQEIDLLYTDHDHLGPDGQRSDPWFKPGWDPDLLLAQDYIGDSTVYRRALVEAVGRLRPAFEEAELYDLKLRVTAACAPARVRHLPAILYHRRAENEAVASEKTLPTLRIIRAANRAVRDHLDSLGNTKPLLKPAPLSVGAIRIVWPLPDSPPLVSVIIPTRDHADLLEQCVEGILQRTDYSNIELLIVDNGSIEPATAELFDRLSRECQNARILRHPGPFNYAAMNNAAARSAKGEVLLLLNNDIDVIASDWLREMVSHALRPDVGIVGAKLVYANEMIQHGGVVLGPQGRITHLHRFASRNNPGYRGQLSLARTLSAVTGACFAIRRAVFFEVGEFDETNLRVGFNDIDLCLRLRKFGYRVVWTPFAELFHLESVSRGYDDFGELFQLESVLRTYEDADPDERERGQREWQHMHRTWGDMLDNGDPFHNPNLLFHWDHLEIPSEPRRKKPWRSPSTSQST